MPKSKFSQLLQRRSGLFWLWVSLDVIILDQVTKYLALKMIGSEQTITVLPFLNFILRYNYGAAFSFLGNQSGWQVYLIGFIVVAVVMSLIVWLKRLPAIQKWLCVSLGLIIGGAIGNLIDRIRLGYVIDFIDFHISTWHYATFNIADAAISAGAIMLILQFLFVRGR